MSPAEQNGRRRGGADRWCTVARPAPRLAYLEAPAAYPRLHQGLWCRLTGIIRARGLIADTGPAARMINFASLSELVDEHGIIRDMPAFVSQYRAYAGKIEPVSAQTAWADIKRLTGRGLMRQIQAAAPGYAAVYCLSYPAAYVDEQLAGLPRDLARALPHLRPAAGQDMDEERPPEDPAAEETGDDPELTGDLGQPETSPDLGPCGRLDTSPLMHDGYPLPQPGSGHIRAYHRPEWPARGGNHDQQASDAQHLLARCRAEWVRQRGEDRVPALDQAAKLAPLTARALRILGRPSDVEQLLTSRVASAEDLLRTLRWRLARELADARRAEQARLSPEEELAAERRAAEYYAGRHAAARAAVEARRSAGHQQRARGAVELARRLAAEHKTLFTDDPGLTKEISARRDADRKQQIDQWRAQTTAAEAEAQALDRIRALLAGDDGDRKRARALAQMTASRARKAPAAGGPVRLW
ncbi:MAG TPA: hypothetical protein VGG75_14760 [Trebonia sp.]